MGDSVFEYLDKIYADRFYSVATRVDEAKIKRPHDNTLALPANTWEMTPLMFTVIRVNSVGSFVDVMVNQAIAQTRSLLAQKHDVNAQDAHGRTALMYIVMGHHYVDNYGHMPGRERLTRVLLESGADPSVKDHLGKTALDYFIAELGEEHPATRLIGEALAAKSMAALSVSSSLPEPSTSNDSISVGGDRAFFPSSPVLSGAQNTVLPVSPKTEIEAKRAPSSSPDRGPS